MKTKYTHLFTPIKLGNVTFKNRIFSAPRSLQELSPERTLRPEDIAFFELTAMGGAANVTVGQTHVVSSGRVHHKELEMDNPNVMAGLHHVARTIKRHGAVASIELGHGGKYSGVKNLENPNPEFPAYGPIYEIENGTVVHQMDEGHIMDIVEAYRTSASLIKQAGFEMVMIHGGHGWLIDQFLSPKNTREDKYGGCLENRLRFPIMILKAVREAVGPGFPIEFRMNGSQVIEGGTTLEQAIEIAKGLQDYVDMFNISAGNQNDPECFVRTHPDMFRPHGLNLEMAAEIKKNVHVPVSVVGAINDLDECEEWIASGKVDAVSMARELMADPFMPKKAKEGRYEDIVKCMRCHYCFSTIIGPRDVACALNPVIGEEERFICPPAPPKKLKKVLVAGGGVGGMQAAVSAADRGHTVILCESSDKLGGAVLNEKHVDFKKNFYHFAHTYLPAQVAKNPNIELRMNTKVTPELVAEIQPDALICAIGATPIKPPFEGIDDNRVIFANDLHRDDLEIGERVVIIGGGLVGTESAIDFRNKGKKVTILEMKDDFASDANMFHKMGLNIQVRNGIDMRTGVKVLKITEEGVVAADKDNNEMVFPADTILCAVGMRSRSDEVEALRDTVIDFIPLGDCYRPGQAVAAIHHGYYAGLYL